MRTKKLLSVLLAVIMVIGLVPGTVFAAEGAVNCTLAIKDSAGQQIMTVNCNCSDLTQHSTCYFTLPSTIEGYDVESFTFGATTFGPGDTFDLANTMYSCWEHNNNPDIGDTITLIGNKIEEKVAAIGETQYSSLAAAVNAAGANDTITLLADIEISEETTFNMVNGTVLDLNGKTIKADDGKAIFAGTAFTIKNGTVTGFNGKDYYAITIDSASTTALRSASNIVLEGLTFTNTGVKIRGGATVTLKDNKITANQTGFKYAVWAFGSANVTIESGTYFGGKNGYDVFAEGKAKFVANGGTYKFKIVERNIVDENLELIENEDGTYSVEKFVGVASVNEKQYKTLQAAIDAANADDTVTLLANITEQIVINKSLTLNLGYYTITGNTDGAVVRAYSDVVDTTINVTIDATTGGIVNTGSGYAIYAGEDLADNDGDVDDAERTNLTINGGNYETAGTDCIKQIMGLCTINGGSYKSGYGRTVLNGQRWYGSEFAINGGTFYEFNPACVSVWTGFEGQNFDNFYHQHDIIAAGKTATYADGWYTVVNGEYTPVAEMKSLCYPSVEAALIASIELNDVANLGVITLLTDDTLDLGGETIELPKGLVIDLNGKTLTTTGVTFTGNNITIKNGKIDLPESNTNYYVLFIGSQDGGKTTATLNSVETTAGIQAINADVTMENVTAKGGNNKSRFAVAAFLGSNVTITSGSFTSHANAKRDLSKDDTSAFAVSGGTYSKNVPDDYLAEGFISVKDGSKYIVREGKQVAEVNGIKYESLQDAINAAPTYYTVTLLADVETTEQIVINKSINLDLGTYTISGDNEDAIVRIYSAEVDKKIDVTIVATTGGIVNEGTGYAIYAGKDLEGGIDAERTNLTINGGNYETAGTDCIKQIMGLCTINGGSYKSGYGRTVLNGQRWYGSEFAINGGTFYEFNPACVSVWTGFEGQNFDNFYHQHDIIAAGKTATYADGWYTVVNGEYTPVAEMKSLCYPSIEAALKASIELNDVANLGVITLLADDEISTAETFELPKGLVIDLNGKTLTVPNLTIFSGENITIKNGKIDYVGDKGAMDYVIFIGANSTVTLENVTARAGINVGANSYVKLIDVEAMNYKKYYAIYAADGAKVDVMSGNYRPGTAKRANVYGDVTIYGGTFMNMLAADTVADGRFVAQTGAAAYTVYEDLQTAIDNAMAGKSVTLFGDVDTDAVITINKKLTLNLGAYTITSTAAKNVIYSTADLTINATTGGIVSETACTAILQDNGVCTINGGSFKASGDTGDHANGKPVYNTLVLNNTDFYEGVTGSFVINDGKFYMFNPACVSINKHDHHNHDQIADGKIATLDADGWFTVTDGEFAYKVVCHPTSPASAHQHCFATEAEAKMFIEMMGNCKFDKVEEIAE